MTTDQPTLAVSQADREAAEAAIDAEFCGTLSVSDEMIQAFARHRTNSEPRPAGDLREAIADIIEANVSGPNMRQLGIDPAFHRADQLTAADRILFLLATHSPAPMAGEGWIVGNNVGQWRTFDSFGWAWTNRRDLAVRYARREDAELVHGDDEDSWRVEQYPAAAHPSTQGV